jgi:type I restriction enzyme S subunit
LRDLPSGWITAPVTKIAQLIRGVTYTKGDARESIAPGLVGIVRANNIGDFRFDFSDLVYVPGRFVSEDQKLQIGDVVIATSSGSVSVVGKAAQVRSSMPLSFGAFCGVLRPSAEVDARYFGRYFQTAQYRLAASVAARGVNINNLKRSHFDSFEIAIAPRATQSKIADKLDTLLGKVNSCQARLDRVPQILKKFREAVLEAAVSGRLTEEWRIKNGDSVMDIEGRLANARLQEWVGRGKYKPAIKASECECTDFEDLPPSWFRGTLDAVTKSVKDGPHFSPKYQPAGIPFISGGSINPGNIDFSNAKYISQELHEEFSQRCKPERFDVLYTKGGTTGIAAVNTTTSDFSVWVHVAVLKLTSAKLVNPFYIQHALNSPRCYAQSQRYTHGVGNQDLGLTRMVKIVLPVPPIEEQGEIVRRIDELLMLAAGLERQYGKAAASVDNLTPSMLTKAFRGDLVPQDPNDEPADKMMEKIHLTGAVRTTATGRARSNDSSKIITKRSRQGR